MNKEMRQNSMVSVVVLFILTLFELHAQVNGSILFTHATAHIGNGEVIKNSAIGIENGKIKQVFNANVVNPELLKYDTIIDLTGKHMYPGFIAPNSILGLFEIGAVRATRDYDEVGKIIPHVRSLIAYNASSKVSKTVRSNGVLIAQITPRGGRISGTSSIVELDGWNWEDAVYKADDGIHLNWPRATNKNHEKAGEREQKREKELDELRRFFDAARGYISAGYQYEHNARFEAMRALFDGSKTLFIHADFVKEITEAVYFSRSYDLKKMVIVGGYDAWRVPELLQDNHVSVILRRLHRLPAREDDDIDLPYRIPAKLKEAGILFCLDNAGQMEAMQTRNLPFYAGTAAAYGLTKEEAVQSITLNAAKILGIDKTCGSLEEGKDATLIISTGDALDMRSNNIELAYVRGKSLDLDNHQKALHRKFREKYKQSPVSE